MDFDINDIPVELEGVNFPLPGPSKREQGPGIIIDETNFSDKEASEDDDEEPSKKSVIRKEVSKLSTHLKGLMGEANLRYARGDIENSKRMCYEVIRQEPEAFEPYVTLAQMYETSNLKKYKGFLMLASHLAPYNMAITCRLADVAVQEGNLIEAVRCYSRGVKADPRNILFHKKRIEILEQKNEFKKVRLMAKQTMANNIPKEEHEQILKLVMEVAKEHFEQKNYSRAVEALRIPLKRIPEKVTKDVINMILELLIILERYSECLDVFTQFCGFSFDVSIKDNHSLYVNTFEEPRDLHVDLKFKFYVCLVKLKAEHLFVQLIDKILLEDDVESVGDLYLDLIEALLQVNYPYQALKLLVVMVKSKNYSTAAVWLKHAECLTACDMFDQAIEAYFTVMALAPSHVEVLYPLAMLLLQQNKKKEALEVLSQDPSSDKLDVAVLIEQMKLLKQIGDWQGYWRSAELLLSRHCIVPKYWQDYKALGQYSFTIKEKQNKIKALRVFRNESDDIEPDVISIREPSIEDEYEIYRGILQLAKDSKEYALFKKFCFMGLGSKRFQKYSKDIYVVAILAGILNKDIQLAYTLCRELFLRYPKNNLAWNWFLVIATQPDDVRYIRFLRLFKSKFPLEERMLISANYQLSNGQSVGSINAFTKHFKQSPESPYAAFMLGISMLQYYSQKKVYNIQYKKLLAETSTYLFMKYAQTRSKNVEQEIYYNLGRMYQQLGTMYLAEYYYKKVFKVQNDLLEEYPKVLCLKREAAFNLHLIYKNNGNIAAAREILYEHIVI